jgi:MHS family shikimate/dehydroshikimate transporter-like MFS transporter
MSKNNKIFRTVAASGFGTLFEWYDFLIYAVATSLVFNKLFFPTVDPSVGILLSMLTFGVGYVARPLGGILFGHFGDRVGRKSILMTTMVLMGVSTFIIGLLPTYSSIGIWAPISLVILRIIQGLSFGGEWAGASVLILEHSPKKYRGFFSSFVQIGYPLGFLLASGVFLLVTKLSGDQFLEWAWRIPFLLSLVLVFIGVLIRSKIQESPVFEELQKKKKISKFPLLSVFKKEKKPLFLGIGIKISEIAWAYLPAVFFPLWAVNNLGVARSDVMYYVFIAMFVSLFAMPLTAYVGDVVGRRKVFIVVSTAMALLSWPIWHALQTDYFYIGLLPALVGGSMMLSLLSAVLPEMFRAETRYTGASMTNQIGAAIGGGVVPAVASYLILNNGTLGTVGLMMLFLSIITVICVIYNKETNKKSL